jgi:hypothetical protein
MEETLTKIDAARRQLETSIQLFFDAADPVSIFSLASNAWEIIDTLCGIRGVKSLSSESQENVPDGKHLKYDYINEPYRNFFKHADRAPDGSINGFDGTKCDALLFLAVEDYIRLMSKSPIEFQVFQLWFLAINHEKLHEDSFIKIVKQADIIFPSIRDLPRHEQLRLGKRSLIDARSDIDVLEDPRTERSYLRNSE